MKLSKQTVDDLLTLIEHVRTDVSYGCGGTFNLGEDDSYDEKSVKKAERGIDFIKKLIIDRDL